MIHHDPPTYLAPMTFRGRALKPTLGFWIGLCLAAGSLLPLSFAHADPADDSLRFYAVDIWHDPPQSWGPGRGVYLGNGLVLTAAHVIGSAARTRPSVRIAGMDLPAKAIKEGNIERVDLTLLSLTNRNYRSICRCAACRCVKKTCGSVSQSSSRFPKKRRARMSCRRCRFPFASKENSPR